MPRIEKVTTDTFEEKVLGSDDPVLVEFSTSRCPACQAARPLLEGLAEEFDGRVRIVEVDVEAEQDLGTLFRIRAVPTLAFFNHGEIMGGMAGVPPASVLRRKLEELSESCAPRG